MTDHDDSFKNASQEESKGIVSEFVGFMAENKKWWLIPFLVVFLLLGLLLLFGTGAGAPFIYALF